MKDRLVVCTYYVCEKSPCEKRDIAVHFRKECQTCKHYLPLKGVKPAHHNLKREKKYKIAADKRDWE